MESEDGMLIRRSIKKGAERGGRRNAMETTSQELSIKNEVWCDWHIIILSGKFVVKFFATVRNLFAGIEAEQRPKVALDLTHVTQIDSSALTTILNLQKRLQEKKGRIVLIGPNSAIKETFYIVGFNLAVPIFSTRSAFEQSVAAE
jgi:anti-anti-sigma factor